MLYSTDPVSTCTLWMNFVVWKRFHNEMNVEIIFRRLIKDWVAQLADLSQIMTVFVKLKILLQIIDLVLRSFIFQN